MAEGYPIILNLAGRLIVVIGGGGVALRKVQGLLTGGATRIRVVSPAFHPDMPHAATVERIAASYDPKHLAGASMVFAATDSSEVNSAVVQEAHRINAWVCRADADEDNAADFATPATLREGPILLTISSGGSPALSAMIRDRLRDAIDPRWSAMAGAMQTLRPILRNALEPAKRKQVFHELCSNEALAELQQHQLSGLKRWLISRYPELTGGMSPDQT